MTRDFLLAAAIVLGFLAIAEMAWLPIQRRHSRPPARLAAEAVTFGLGCIVLAFAAVVAVVVLAALLLALEAMP